MIFLDLVKNRRSVRQYTDQPVERDKIELCLEAARLAPSACNGQPWKYLVIDDPALKDQVARAICGRVLSFNRFTLTAPALVVVTTDGGAGFARIASLWRGVSLDYIDIGISVEHFCLQAAEQGLGTCILGWTGERKVRKLCGIPRFARVVLALTLGYPASPQAMEKSRKPLESIRKYNSFS